MARISSARKRAGRYEKRLEQVPHNSKAMALYKYEKYLQKTDHQAFDIVFEPGSKTPYSGIYRCENCGDEFASTVANPLPPENHRQHAPANGAILWRLIACDKLTTD
jgi:hypothetical protein